MEAHALTRIPPDPPELPEGAERAPGWPAWFALAGFAMGLAGTVLFGIVLGLIAAVLGSDLQGDSSPALVVVGTVAQGLAFAATAVFLASRVAPPRRWHFGLRPTSLWAGVGWAALGVATFFVVSSIYGALVHTDARQDTVQQLGGDRGTVGLVVAGVMVIVVAPIAEEFFFRGFFYRALRNRFSIALAAIFDGLLFGSVHFSGLGEDLLILPPLALLGVIFCLVYEKTGSIYPVIGMHALNNALAYAVLAEDQGGWQVSVVAFPLMVVACVLAPRLFSDGPGTRRVAPA